MEKNTNTMNNRKVTVNLRRSLNFPFELKPDMHIRSTCVAQKYYNYYEIILKSQTATNLFLQ